MLPQPFGPSYSYDDTCIFMKTSNTQFQETSIPSPWRVIENSKGRWVSKAKIFKGKYQSKLEFPAVLGGLKQNPLWKVCGHHPKQHNKNSDTQIFNCKTVLEFVSKLEQFWRSESPFGGGLSNPNIPYVTNQTVW